MRLLESPVPELDVLAELERIVARDETYARGHILGSMCTVPHAFAARLAAMYPEKNLGDPGLFPGTARLEEETVQMLGDMLGSDRVVGNIVTGGSEANVIAMRVARKTRNIPHPEVIIPASAHASFHKAADFMGFTLRTIPLNENYEIDIGDFERALNDNTVAVVAIAGTTSLGLVDPIEAMGKLVEARDASIFFHVDAAFGGFVLPFLRDLGHHVPGFDFSVPAVTSMTCDPHKMGLNVIPSGGFVLREQFYTDVLGFDIPYLAGGAFKHFNLMGTRPGSVVISCWGLMRHLGRQGFREIVRRCWDTTMYARARLREVEEHVLLAREPVMNVIGLKAASPSISMEQVDKVLRARGWFLGMFKHMDPPLMRLVVMPHVTREAIDAFVEALVQVIKDVA